MAWFKVDDAFHSSKPVMRIPRRNRAAAVGLWTLAGTWSSQEETDGFIPEYLLEELCGTRALAGILVRVGLWEHVTGESQETYSERNANVNGTYRDPEEPGWQFRKWSDYNPLKSELEEKRESERIRKANYRKSQQRPNNVPAGHPEGHQAESSPPDPTRPDPTPLIEEPNGSSLSDAKASDDETVEEVIEFADHVHQLCDYLADKIRANGNKVGKVGITWHKAMDRLIRLDGYTPDQVRQVIDWSQQNEFWQGNILSASKLREKFDPMKNRMFNERSAIPSTGNRSTDRMRAGYEAMNAPVPNRPDPFAPKEITS